MSLFLELKKTRKKQKDFFKEKSWDYLFLVSFIFRIEETLKIKDFFNIMKRYDVKGIIRRDTKKKYPNKKLKKNNRRIFKQQKNL